MLFQIWCKGSDFWQIVKIITTFDYSSRLQSYCKNPPSPIPNFKYFGLSFLWLGYYPRSFSNSSTAFNVLVFLFIRNILQLQVAFFNKP